MAILPTTIGELGDRTIPTTATPKQQPTPLTIEEYKRRQQRKKEEELTAIPTTRKPKHRRAGKLVSMRKKLASLKATVTSDNPPHWQIASKLWKQIDAIEKDLQERKQRKK